MFLSVGALGSSDALVKPFHWTVWFAIVALVALVIGFHRTFNQAEAEGSSWGESLISSVGTLTGQGVCRVLCGVNYVVIT